MSAKAVVVELTKDEIRDHIVRHLYSIHENARGPKSISTGIRDLQKAMKEHGIKSTEVVSNLDYLVQTDWVREVSTPSTFRTPHMVRESSTSTYKLSANAIDKLEGASTYRRENRMGGLNVTNINGVTVVGDGNVVNTEFAGLSRLLTDLEEAIKSSPDLDDEQKLNSIADVSTIQSQLQKPAPDKGIVQRAWSGIAKIADVGTVGDLVLKVAPLVAALAKVAV